MDLKKRIERFTDLEYGLKKDFYIELNKGQNPHTLFIGCSDSRIRAESLLHAEAGEIFHIRNIANIVPREEEPGTHPSVVSAIEYAVKILEVKNIVVCGHSNCGGCAAIWKIDEYRDNLPYTMEWITQSISIAQYIDFKYPNMSETVKAIMLEKLNAIQQLDNLMTYDFIKEKFDSGQLHLEAYYYDIGHGTVATYEYNSVFSDIIEEITSNRKLLEQIEAATE
ncbi:MAG: carbonic anhydrase [Actinomycetaceae bacterium]|nr:carbonic anhydrase [Actinomycetaceae bacterium]